MANSSSTVDRSSPIHNYRTTPDHENTGWPPGIPYIIGNEACERFSYYGMRAILYVHLTSLYVLAGEVAADAKRYATGTTHLFYAGVYALPMIGAIIADRFVGKYRTIIYLSLVYCLGHAVLSVGERSLTGMYIGLALIAIGSGGIKPCVGAHVGDQFGEKNWFRIRSIYMIFYFTVNFGSFVSTLLIPILKEHSGYWVAYFYPRVSEFITLDRLSTSIAFGIPGLLMFIATVLFWMGRKKFVHVPAKPGGEIGLLDTLSSTCLFMTIGHLFVTKSMSWYIILSLSIVFLVLGLALFAWRQKLKPDNGFLAITFFAIQNWLQGRTNQERHENKVDPQGEDNASGPLDSHRLWGPAVRRFGHEEVEGPVAVFKIISVFILALFFWALFDQHTTTWVEQAKQMDRMIHLPWIGTFTLKETQIPALNPLMVMLLIPLMHFLYLGSDRIGIKPTPLRRITVGMFIAALSFVSVAIIQQWIDARGPGTVSIAWQLVPYLLLTVGEVMVSITGLEFAYTQAPKRMKSTIMGFWLLTIAMGNLLVFLFTGITGLEPVMFFWIFAGLMAAAGVMFGIRAYFYTPKDYAQ